MNNSLKKLIEGCQKDDRSAQFDLYERYKVPLYAICLRYSDSKPEAEDILQDAFVKIFNSLSQYLGKGSFEGWMKKIVLRTAIASLRRNKKSFTFSEMHNKLEYCSFPDETLDSEREGMLIKLMRQLSPGYRAILNLHILEGYTHKEIATYLDISEGTSKSQLNRAKARMRILLEKRFTT